MQFKRGFMFPFNKHVESALGTARQHCPVTLRHRDVGPEVRVNWCDPVSEGTRSSNVN